MTTETRLTLEQFLALPETEPASEYICGEVIQKAMPTRGHGVTQGKLLQHSNNFLDVHPLGEAGSEVRCIFGPAGAERAFVPDFTFIAAERLPPGGAGLDGPFYGAPDLAVEILSPDDRPGRVLEKLDFYLRHGVRLVWLLDPQERIVRVLRPDAALAVIHPGATLDGGDVLPGFQVAVAALFPRRLESE